MSTKFAFALTAVCALSAHAGEITGRVIDVDTGQPIEGAYVMATYYEAGGSWFVTSAHWCVETRGMFTAKDGSFRFPDVPRQAPDVHAIKPDHYAIPGGPEVKRWEQAQGKPGPSRHNIYLRRQDPAHFDWHLDDVECERPRNKEAAAANIRFLKLALDEYIKYGASASSIDATRHQIQRLEQLPATRSNHERDQ